MVKKLLIILFLVLIIVFLSFGFYLYKAEPDFFMDRYHKEFYSDRLRPVSEVLLNDDSVFYEMKEEEWYLKKNNGRWYAPPEENIEIDISNYEVKPVAFPASPEDILSVKVDKEPDTVFLKVTEKDSGEVLLDEQVVLSRLPLPGKNGNFIYELTIEWEGKSKPYTGKYVMEIPVEIDFPVKFVFSQEELIQGQMMEVNVYYAQGPEDIVFEQGIYDKFKWHRQEGFLRGYLPTNYSVEPGAYKILYGVRSKGTSETREIEIKEYDYHIQHLTIDPKTEEETRSDEAYEEYYKYYTPVRNQSEPSRYYKDDFVLPTNGRLTTEFGETRYVNELPTSYRHLGIDIAAKEGTPVKATNRGKVVLAKSLMLTGNTIMIDHGEGLFSVYHHLQDISVNTGDIVLRGQEIGGVGSTGFSTGPHLHFTMSHYSTNMEPGYFLFGEPITYENYNKFLVE